MAARASRLSAAVAGSGTVFRVKLWVLPELLLRLAPFMYTAKPE